MLQRDPIPTIPLHQWILKDRLNRIYCLFAGVVTILAFIWLKSRYPYPNFLPDSYSYLEAAFRNRGISMWPIGYSAFLRFFSSITRSDTALVFVQYALLQVAILYFVFSIRYLLSPGRWFFGVILVCCLINPLSLYVSNFISSDALFATLSLVWFTQLLWILYRPGTRLLILHAFVLFLAFTVRYNALYYPLISMAVIVFTRMETGKKLLAAGCMLVLLGGFVGVNMDKYRRLTGTPQFSAFGGWQLASNALFAYAHARPEDPAQVPLVFRSLHAMVNRHMDSLDRLTTFRPDSKLGVYYLWDDHAPLKAYLREEWKTEPATDEYKKWASMGPLYAKYGAWLIRQRPVDFLKYYIGPNLINYYVPNSEFMSMYNMGFDTVDNIAMVWFGYPSKKIQYSSAKISVAEVYPVLLAVVNLLFLLCFAGYGLLGGFRKSGTYAAAVFRWMMVIWIANLVFSVVASPIVLRYQVFPMLITFVFLMLLLEFLTGETRMIHKGQILLPGQMALK